MHPVHVHQPTPIATLTLIPNQNPSLHSRPTHHHIHCTAHFGSFKILSARKFQNSLSYLSQKGFQQGSCGLIQDPVFRAPFIKTGITQTSTTDLAGRGLKSPGIDTNPAKHEETPPCLFNVLLDSSSYLTKFTPPSVAKTYISQSHQQTQVCHQHSTIFYTSGWPVI